MAQRRSYSCAGARRDVFFPKAGHWCVQCSLVGCRLRATRTENSLSFNQEGATMSKRRAYFMPLIGIAVLVLAMPASAGGDADSRVFPVNSNPYGYSYAEWSAMHWQ